jgi:hypothetical protein
MIAASGDSMQDGGGVSMKLHNQAKAMEARRRG